MYTLGTAAKATGLAKSTIHRAIKRGIISARSKDGNGYEIDPAELHRVYPPVAGVGGVPSNASNSPAAPPVERYATLEENGSNEGRTPGTPRTVPVAVAHEVELKLAKAEAALDGLKALLEAEKRRADEMKELVDEVRQERDRWATMAESAQRQLTDQTKRASGGLWGWLRRG